MDHGEGSTMRWGTDRARANERQRQAEEIARLRQHLEAIIQLASQDPVAYLHETNFHAAVHIARKALVGT